MAAYEHGEEWYLSLMEYLTGNLEFLDRELKEKVPEVKLVYPQSTYIPLLDMSELKLTNDEMKDFLIQKVGAALNAGSTFGPGGDIFMRINTATQRENLRIFVSRLAEAVGKLL